MAKRSKDKYEMGEHGELVECKEPPFPFALDLPDGHHCRMISGANGFTKRGHEFHLSPGMRSSWEDLHAEMQGLNAFVEQANSFVLKAQQRIARHRQRFWNNVRETINLPASAEESHDIKMLAGGVVSITPKAPQSSVPPQATK